MAELEKTGKATPEELAAASQAVEDLSRKLQTMKTSAVDASDSVATAFAALHIKSQSALSQTATDYKSALDTIVEAAGRGVAAQSDVVRAFATYAAAARAASADSGTAAQETTNDQLAVLASVLNVKDAFAKAGDAGKKAGQDTADAYNDAKTAVDDTAASAATLGKNTAAAAASTQTLQKQLGGVVGISADAGRALSFMNDILNRTGTLANVSLTDAQYLLTNLGVLAGAQTEILTARIQELTQATDQAKQVADSMASEAADLQDQIDQIQGNDVAIEDRRHTQKLADIKAEGEANGTESTEAYRNLVALEDKLHALKLANIQSEQKASGGGSSNTSGKPSESSQPTTSGTGNTSSSSAVTTSPGKAASNALAPVYNFNFTGGIYNGTPDQFAEALARTIKPQLDAIAARSR